MDNSFIYMNKLIKSQDEVYKDLIASIVRSVSQTHAGVITHHQAELTIKKIVKRIDVEGRSFLTKRLPLLGKALDRALAGGSALDCPGFQKLPGSQLPKLFGELFQRVLSQDGTVLPDPCVRSIRALRQLLFVFYKLEEPYAAETKQEVIDRFKQTEEDIFVYHKQFSKCATILATSRDLAAAYWNCSNHPEDSSAERRQNLNRALEALIGAADDPSEVKGLASCMQSSIFPELCSWENLKLHRVIEPDLLQVVARARRKLHSLLTCFDPLDIVPRHGPGAVSTGEKMEKKFSFSQIPERMSQVFPIDEYFFVNMDHVCDRYTELKKLGSKESPAKVTLVPKDSRGPRLISMEPLENQWIQQGLMRSLVTHIEESPLTKWNVFFSDQGPNQRGALLGSSTGSYATLDLKDASDRVTLGLVKFLFPERIFDAFMACRSSVTLLPNGELQTLCKFAPMGSALCFPVMALVIWSILDSVAEDAYTRERILVYGDDIIVPTAFADTAMTTLTRCGLAVNRDKSCTKGFFRESCGVDAYRGENVTPVRIRRGWSVVPSPSSYASWIATANHFARLGYWSTYDTIADALLKVYRVVPTVDSISYFGPRGRIPSYRSVELLTPHNEKAVDIDTREEWVAQFGAPCLLYSPVHWTPQEFKTRWNPNLQRWETRVRTLASRERKIVIDGWSMLLRYFTEKAGCIPTRQVLPFHERFRASTDVEAATSALHSALYELDESTPFQASVYTKRKTNHFVYRWR